MVSYVCIWTFVKSFWIGKTRNTVSDFQDKRRMPLLSCSSLSDTQKFATVKFTLHKSRRYDEGMIYHALHDEWCSRPWCTESYVQNYWGSYKIFKGLLKIAQDLTLTIAARCLKDLAKIYAKILQGLKTILARSLSKISAGSLKIHEDLGYDRNKNFKISINTYKVSWSGSLWS